MSKTTTFRNFGIIAHVDAGKTTLTERLLFHAGVTGRAGSIEKQNTTMDTGAIEKKRGITIKSAAISFEYASKQKSAFVNLIDTPGHADFVFEVERSLAALDAVVLVIDAVKGVEPQSEVVFDKAQKRGLPAICFINKIDHPAADTQNAMGTLEKRLGVTPIDAAALFERDESALSLLSCLSDVSAKSSDDELFAALQEALVAGELMPVFCGSAKNDIGVKTLLDNIVDLFPNASVPSDKTRALVFKTTVDQHGVLSWVRVFGGRLFKGQSLFTSHSDKALRMGRVVRLKSDKRIDIDSLEAGDIGALVGLDVPSGTLLGESLEGLHDSAFEIPEPVMGLAIEPGVESERERFEKAVGRLLREDPSLERRVSAETGETTLWGLGELHLDVVLTKLDEMVKGGVRSNAPEVALRETFETSAEIECKLQKQNGGPGSFARVRILLEPLPRGEGIVFESVIKGGEVSQPYVRAFEKGLRAESTSGALTGYAITDYKVTLLSGEMHDNDSSEKSFSDVAKLVIKAAYQKCAPYVLEPLARVECSTGPESTGAVVAELSKRRGVVTKQSARALRREVCALVPLDEMFGFASRLQSISHGRGQVTMRFAHYARRPS